MRIARNVILQRILLKIFFSFHWNFATVFTGRSNIANAAVNHTLDAIFQMVNLSD